MKIAVILTSNLYHRNYVKTGVINSLAEHHEVKIFTTKDFNVKIKDAKEITVPKFIRYALSLFADYRTYIFRQKSTSFEYRIFRRGQSESLRKRLRNCVFIYLSKIPFLYNCIAVFMDCSLFSINLVRRDSLNDFQLLLIPNSGFDPDADFFVSRANFLGIRSVLLIDNWDNLSSKTIIYFKPSEIFVLGEQSRDHAINIQGLPRESIKVIGTPRFEVYRHKPTKLFDFKYILFAGGSLPFDEISFLTRLQSFCMMNNLKVIYRPHPWRQKHDSNYFKRLSVLDFVVLDPQLDGISIASNNMDFQPDLLYYNSLIRGSEFLVTPLSTFILEALICNKSVIVVVEDNVVNNYITSPANVYKNYEHFKGIQNLTNVYLKTDDVNLEFLLSRALFNSSNEVNQCDFSYYIHFTHETYNNNLLRCI